MAKTACCKEAKNLFYFIVTGVQGKRNSWEGDVAHPEEEKCTQELLKLENPKRYTGRSRLGSKYNIKMGIKD